MTGPDIGPPKTHERVLRGLGYLSVGLTAAWLLILPPSGIATDLGKLLTIVWSCFLLTAVPAALAAFTGKYRAEYACIPWFSAALILALIHSWILVFNGALDFAPRTLVTGAFVCLVASRFASLHQLVKIRPKGDRWTRKSSKQ